ncbi:ABC transporter permease subunit [Dietzia sp. SLG310A2-38A2]|nr:ABC transporter permease subunit [Dietzia sp. SLG310A2-38A2]
MTPTVAGGPRWGWLAAVPGVLFLLAFALYPLVSLTQNAIGLGRTGLREESGLTADYLVAALTSEAIRRAVVNSLTVCVSAVAIAIALSIPLVLHLAARSHVGRNTSPLDSAFTLPVALPGTIIGFFAVVLLGNTGLLGLWFPQLAGTAYIIPGLVVAYTYFSLPRIIGPLRGAAENLDPAMPETARSLGAGRTRVFVTVTLPLLLPAIIEASGTALAVALGGYGTIAVLARGDRLLPLEVVDGLSSAGFNIATASANALILAVLAAGFLLAGRAVARITERMVAR